MYKIYKSGSFCKFHFLSPSCYFFTHSYYLIESIFQLVISVYTVKFSKKLNPKLNLYTIL